MYRELMETYRLYWNIVPFFYFPSYLISNLFEETAVFTKRVRTTFEQTTNKTPIKLEQTYHKLSKEVKTYQNLSKPINSFYSTLLIYSSLSMRVSCITIAIHKNSVYRKTTTSVFIMKKQLYSKFRIKNYS